MKVRPKFDEVRDEVWDKVLNKLCPQPSFFSVVGGMMAGNSVYAMNRTRTCGRCGAEVPDFAPDRLCLHCLFDSAYDPDPISSPERDGIAAPAPDSCGSPSTGAFGEYDLLGELGRGGQGRVYRARHRALGRTVALKVVPASGLAGQTAGERFRLEAATASQLDHPNIVPIYEVGERDGFSYYAMKLMEGGTIDQALKPGATEDSPPRLIARLMSRVAHAVHHAHQRGVLHRDLKPSNILLDAELEPHVTDFGLARWLEQESSLTLSHAILGTAAYLAPEIARHGASRATVASDVYGLGAVLYELLAGRPPFTGSSLADILRQVQDEEPRPPKAEGRSKKEEGGKGIAELRFANCDLETICLKCLDKEPARRYPSAQALADDFDRFLNDEPILARPVTRLERAWRWCRRKPALATASLLILLLLVIVIIGSPIAAYRINEARRQAAEEAAIAAAMNEFLTEDLLRQADVWNAEAHASPNRDIRLLEVVNRASEGVDAKFGNQPLVAAKIHLTVGSVYAGLGEIEKAEHHLRAAKGLFESHAGPDDLRTLEVNHALAVLLRVNRAAYEEAETLIRQVLRVRQRTLGPDHRDTLSAMLELAWVRNDRQSHEEAQALFAQVERQASLTLGTTAPLMLSAREGRIETLYAGGERSEGVRLQQELWETRRRVQGESHPETLKTLTTLVAFHRNHDTPYPLIEPLIESGLELSRRVFGERGVTESLELSRAVILRHRGLFREGKDLRQRVLDNALRYYGPNHLRTLQARQFLGYYYGREGGDDAEAARILEETLASYRRLAPDSFNAQINRGRLASVCWRLGRREDASNLLNELLEVQGRLYGHDSEGAQSTLRALAGLHARTGDWASAAPLLAEAAASPRASARDLANAIIVHALERPTAHSVDPMGREWASLLEAADQADRAHLLTALLLVSLGEFSGPLWEGGPHGVFTANAEVTEKILAAARSGAASNSSEPAFRLLSGLTDIAKQDWTTAAERLAPFASWSPEANTRVLSGFLLTMALHHGGLASGAEMAFDQANGTLTRMAAGGDLGRGWDRFALSLLARDRAALLLTAPGELHPIDAPWLADVRSSWGPVQAAIDHAFLFAQHRQWEDASLALQSAMGMRGFTWEAAELLISRWTLKSALIMASADEPIAHPHFADARGFEATFAPPTLNAVSLVPVQTGSGSDDPIWVDAHELAFVPDTEGAQREPGWIPLMNGLQMLREGRTSEALAEFHEARRSFNLHCACAAYAYASQAHLHLEDTQSALAMWDHAAMLLRRLHESHGDDLGRHWFDLRLCELAVDGARLELEQPTRRP